MSFFFLACLVIGVFSAGGPACPMRSCPSEQTCCGLVAQGFGCCPKYSNATCCGDNIHCCPNQYTCDVPNKTCKPVDKKHKRNAEEVAISKIIIYRKPQDTCPTGTCNPTETCCSAGGGNFGCCPYPNADCCSDHKHCCPNGYTCDLSKGECVKSGVTSNIKKTLSLSAIIVTPKPQDTCPTGTCKPTETCCSAGGGNFGCCPYANADCCSDHKHCCPNGYTCDLSKGECVKSGVTSNIKKTLSLSAIIVTPKPQDTCPTGTCKPTETCCSAGGGNFGCCPYPNADCCSDHKHCCPNGYTCDLSKGECVKSGAHGFGVPRTTSLKTIVAGGSLTAPTCPVGTCPTTQTCCDLGNGEWGCCPYPNANCCSDHAHCCPENYSCDVKQQQCVHSVSPHGIFGVIKTTPLSLKKVLKF